MTELAQAERGYNGCLSDAVHGRRALSDGRRQPVGLGKYGFTSQIGHKILDTRNGVAIRSPDSFRIDEY